jgi:hypothetical protein
MAGSGEKGFGTGGMMLLYGVMIGQALKAKSVGVQELLVLRDQVRATVSAQGNLVEALAELEAEIDRRGGEAAARPAAKSGPAAPSLVGPKFLVQIMDMDLADAAVRRIEQGMRDLVMNEIARVDTKGDFVATPLSEMKSWGGGGISGHTAGMYISRQ